MRTGTLQFLFFVSLIRRLKREISLPTCLGMLFVKHINFHHVVYHALRPFNAELRVWNGKRISDRLHAMLWLFKTCALLAGMYACQIWSTQFLEHDYVVSNPL